jgi:hypothetical protein
MHLGFRNIILLAGSTLCFARYSFAQNWCSNQPPPLNINSTIGVVYVNHSLNFGVIEWSSGSALICPSLFNNFSIQNYMFFGGFLSPCEAFSYELSFDKPILSLTFILHGGGGGSPDGPDGGSEIHVFEIGRAHV